MLSNPTMNQYQNLRSSNLAFLRSPSEHNIRLSGQQLSNLLTDQIFLRGLKNSYIGQISGQKQQIKEIKFQDFLPAIEEQQLGPNNHKHHRINFSSFRGVATSKIIKSDKILEEMAEEEDQQKLVKIHNKDILKLKSFVGKEKVQLFTPSNCGFCSQGAKSNHVRIQLLNQSTLQLYCSRSQQEKLPQQYTKLLFSLNFDTANADVHISDQINSKQLVIRVGDYRILLEHQSRAVIKDWFKKINAMRLQSKGKDFNLKKVLETDQFYLRRFESEQFFINNCQTGDVILFQDDHFFAKVQRFLTRSSFDHVAMVIKDLNYGILLFQSNSGSGVSLTPWRSLIRYGWYEHIPRIAWRRLEIQRNTSFNTAIQKFVKDNLQKCYHISFEKLLSAQSYIRPAPLDNIKGQKGQKGQKVVEQGYFCSELVATAYKELGILTRDRTNPNYQPACNFYPKDFSERANRKLDKGSLSPQYDIFFDKAVLKLRYKHLIRD